MHAGNRCSLLPKRGSSMGTMRSLRSPLASPAMCLVRESPSMGSGS